MVYAVEDDEAIRELYQCSLEGEFGCRCFHDGDSFFAAAEGAPPDLVLLDVMLAGGDGFEILARLKNNRATAKIPVIMVSAKSEEHAKVKGLNMGADDYVAKPFGVLELIARIKANLRKGGGADGIQCGDVYIDFLKREVSANGRPVRTTLKEFNLLRLLAENAGKVMERDEIFARVWKEDFVGETRTLDIHVKELRKKLAEAESSAEIKTVRGVGYMLA